MKDYSIKEKNQPKQPTFITNFEVVGEDMVIYTSDGNNTIAPHNKANLKMIRDKMLEQGKKAQMLLSSKKKKRNVARIIGAAGIAGMVIVNASELGRNLNPIFINGSLGGIAFISGVGALRNSQLILDLRKLGLFIKHKDEINKALTNNPYMYNNISSRDHKLLEEWIKESVNEPLSIEKLDQISPRTMSTIWKNIEMSREFNLNYETCNTNSGYQKTNR